MRFARTLLLAVVALHTPARPGEIRWSVEPGETVGQLLRRLGEQVDALILYPLEGVEGASAGGPHQLTLPEGRLLDGVRFVLSLRGLDLRALGDEPTVIAVTGRTALRPEYRTADLGLTLYLNRAPVQWERESDLADSLAADTVDELLGVLRGSSPQAQACAALLLGRLGPPSPPVIAALQAALSAPDAIVRQRAAQALGAVGYAARAALEEIDALAAREGAPFVAVARRIREAPHPALFSPTLARERAPDRFRLRCTTSKGPFLVAVERAWAPNGADRLYNLVRIGYFKEIAIFRVLPRFVAQWGIHGDPRVNAAWRLARIEDDPVTVPNDRGTVVFATQGSEKNSRTVQLFVNTGDNRKGLDSLGFAPVGRVIEGLDVLDRLYSGYGDGPPQGRGPVQARFQSEGNAYLTREFPELDFLRTVEIEAAKDE